MRGRASRKLISTLCSGTVGPRALLGFLRHPERGLGRLGRRPAILSKWRRVGLLPSLRSEQTANLRVWDGGRTPLSCSKGEGETARSPPHPAIGAILLLARLELVGAATLTPSLLHFEVRSRHSFLVSSEPLPSAPRQGFSPGMLIRKALLTISQSQCSPSQ